MAKYYIKSGTLEMIYSCNKTSFEAAQDCVWELNDMDTLDEHFYIDERGYRTSTTCDTQTIIYTSESVLSAAGWNIEDV